MYFVLVTERARDGTEVCAVPCMTIEEARLKIQEIMTGFNRSALTCRLFEAGAEWSVALEEVEEPQPPVKVIKTVVKNLPPKMLELQGSTSYMD
jgi:hypothetical protein